MWRTPSIWRQCDPLRLVSLCTSINHNENEETLHFVSLQLSPFISYGVEMNYVGVTNSFDVSFFIYQQLLFVVIEFFRPMFIIPYEFIDAIAVRISR